MKTGFSPTKKGSCTQEFRALLQAFSVKIGLSYGLVYMLLTMYRMCIMHFISGIFWLLPGRMNHSLAYSQMENLLNINYQAKSLLTITSEVIPKFRNKNGKLCQWWEALQLMNYFQCR